MLTNTKIDVVVIDDATGTTYHFTTPEDLLQTLDITPIELALALCMPNGEVINDRFYLHKIYLGDLEKLTKDIIIIFPDDKAVIVSDARVAAIMTGYDIASIAYSIDADSSLDLPVKFISMANFIKSVNDNFNYQMRELRPQPNLTVKPNRQAVFNMLTELEKAVSALDNNSVFLPTPTVGKTNEIDPGEYVITDHSKDKKHAEDRCREYKKQAVPLISTIILEPNHNNYPRTNSTSLKLVDLALGKELFFSSYKQIAKFLGMSANDEDVQYLRDLRNTQEPINGYLIRLANDNYPLPGPF
jgi:hypothetical protein